MSRTDTHDVWQGSHSKAVPFDMYVGGGFGHEGENCTFETLCLRFGIRDKVVHLIGQAIHHADFDDGKFGRTEGITINHVLNPPIPRVEFHDICPGRDLEMSDGFMAIEGEYC